MQLSNRVQAMNESATLKMARLSREMQDKGHNVINMSLGEPDFNTPDYLKHAGKKAIDEGYTKYTPVPGFPSLRQAICNKYKRDNGLDYKPEQIVVSTGAKQTIANIILASINPGDDVLLPAPFWVSYKDIIDFAGGNAIEVPTSTTNDFKVNSKVLDQYITPNTKMFLFSNPCNPSGTLYSKDQLEDLANYFADKKDITIVSDEIYELISFEEFTSFGAFSQVTDQLILVGGVSKGYSMTGWRIGYMVAPKEMAVACSKIQSQFTSGANAMAQKAAEHAYECLPSEVEFMKTKFEKRRNLIFELLSQIEDVKVNKPQGAFYIFPDIGAFLGKSFNGKKIETSADLCQYLLEEKYVGITPGEAFGSPNNIRLSYATDDESIKEAVKRIEEALKALT